MIRKHGSTLKISEDELTLLSLILDQGVETSTAIQLSFDESSRIIEEIHKGRKIISILTENQSKSFFVYLSTLSSHCTLKQSISCAKEIDQYSNMIGLGFLKRISYPLFIFSFSFVLILFFKNMILPQIDIYSVDKLSKLTLSLLLLLDKFVLICVFVVCAIMLIEHKFNIKLYDFNKNIRILKIVHSMQFVRFLQVLMKQGMSTQEAIKIFCTIKSKGILKIIGTQIKDDLEKGISLKETIVRCNYLDTFLYKMFSIGNLVNISQCFELYLVKREFDLKKKIRCISIYIQLIAYIQVGILVICVYQILLMPLNMLYSF